MVAGSMTDTHDKPGFTEGPWLLATSCSWRRFLNQNLDPVVVPTVHRDGHPDLQVSEADARLIAQAPKLYELLEQIVLTLSTLEVQGDHVLVSALKLQYAEARELLREVRYG